MILSITCINAELKYAEPERGERLLFRNWLIVIMKWAGAERGYRLWNGISKMMDRRKPGLLATINVVN